MSLSVAVYLETNVLIANLEQLTDETLQDKM